MEGAGAEISAAPRNPPSQFRRFAFYQRLCLGDEIRQRHRALVAFAAGAHAYCVRCFFLVAEDEDVWRLLVGQVADFRVHLFVAIVHFHAQAQLLSTRFPLWPRSPCAAR